MQFSVNLADFSFIWQQCSGGQSAALLPCDFIAALVFGLLKTLGMIAASILSATGLGLVLGAAWLAGRGLVRLLIEGFARLMRHLPAPLTVLILFFAALATLQGAQSGLALPLGAQLNELGLTLPWLQSLPFFPLPAPHLSLAFLALWLALTLHGAAGIVQAMRRNLEAMVDEQGRAARALGLQGAQSLKFVLLPQARRLLAAPLRQQWAALVRLSPLAILTGYADLATNGMAYAMLHSAQEVLLVVLVWVLVYGGLAAILSPARSSLALPAQP